MGQIRSHVAQVGEAVARKGGLAPARVAELASAIASGGLSGEERGAVGGARAAARVRDLRPGRNDGTYLPLRIVGVVERRGSSDCCLVGVDSEGAACAVTGFGVRGDVARGLRDRHSVVLLDPAWVACSLGFAGGEALDFAAATVPRAHLLVSGRPFPKVPVHSGAATVVSSLSDL